MHPYQKLNWYPHLGSQEQILWDRFIHAFPDLYDKCEYDVKVGSGPEFDTIVSPDTMGDVKALYQKKLDVVAYKGGEVDIIEIKPYAGTNAVSQLLQYQFLLMKDRKLEKPPKLVIVTDRVKADLHDFAVLHGVTVVVV